MLMPGNAIPLGDVLGGAQPTPVDHRPIMRPVRDQGQKGYCFAFATAAVKEANCVFWETSRGGPATPLGAYLSPDYIGWKTQTGEGTFGQDAGGSLGDSFACVQGWGVCPESFLPYNPNDMAHAGRPDSDVAARPYRFGTPCHVPIDPDAFAQVLSSNHVIAIGFAVYPSFESTGPSGVVQPVSDGEPLLGGHAVTVVGFDFTPVTKQRVFIVRNQWSANWGDDGYCYMDDSYFSNVFDAWTTA
jgi:hypothetical protein